MKKIIAGAVTAAIILSISIYLIFIIGGGSKNNEKLNDFQAGNLMDYNNYLNLNKDNPAITYVPDAKTARELAEVILYPIFGESINKRKPFIVEFDDKNQVWIVKGQLPQNYDGGVPYIIIQKNDGKILAVWHTK